MKISFYDENAFDEFTAWALVDKKIYKKIISLIKDIRRNPAGGIGKPEPLRYDMSGCWSRRITDEHRLVYHTTENNEEVIILSCEKHYAVK